MVQIIFCFAVNGGQGPGHRVLRRKSILTSSSVSNCIFRTPIPIPSMAASVRIFLPCKRHFPHSLLLKTPPFSYPFLRTQPLHSPSQFPSLSLHHRSPSLFKSLSFDLPSFSSSSSKFFFTDKHFASIFSGPKDNSLLWNFACVGDGSNRVPVVDEKGPEVAVVLLGWLGANPKNLRRYIELYNARGIHAVTFVASVRDALSFDLGKRLEERIQRLALELASWLSNKDGRERFLIFHTFSNTGWLAYGAILESLKARKDLLQKIKGCVVDSGGDPNIDPKVWAAGFTTALLKKSSSATYPLSGTGEGTELRVGINGVKLEEKKPLFIETLLLSAFEKLFSFLLNLPDVNQRLANIISTLSKNQPPCPQLYLYSTGDKVIPFQAIESFIEDQRRSGKQVFSFNFVASPHVDHYRPFPDIYASQLDEFLKECRVVKVEKL